MRKAIAATLLLLTLPLSAGAFEERNKAGLQVELRGAYTAARFNLARNSRASYGGWDYGITVVPKARAKGLTISSAFMADKRKMTNSANASGTSEDLSGTVFALGGRIYSGELYVGGALVYSKFDVDYKTNSQASQTKYRAYGVRMEAGLDVELFNGFILAPKLSYEILNANTPSDEKTRKLNTLGLGVGLGIRF